MMNDASTMIRHRSYNGASRYDVRIRGGRGGHGKAGGVREVALMLEYKLVPNADKGGGCQKIQKSCGRHIWTLPKDVSVFG